MRSDFSSDQYGDLVGQRHRISQLVTLLGAAQRELFLLKHHDRCKVPSRLLLSGATTRRLKSVAGMILCVAEPLKLR